jgi:hypothetical protein
MMFLSFRSFCFLRLTLILAGAAIDHYPLLCVVPPLSPRNSAHAPVAFQAGQFVSPHHAAMSNGFGLCEMYSGHVGTQRGSGPRPMQWLVRRLTLETTRTSAWLFAAKLSTGGCPNFHLVVFCRNSIAEIQHVTISTADRTLRDDLSAGKNVTDGELCVICRHRDA